MKAERFDQIVKRMTELENPIEDPIVDQDFDDLASAIRAVADLRDLPVPLEDALFHIETLMHTIEAIWNQDGQEPKWLRKSAAALLAVKEKEYSNIQDRLRNFHNGALLTSTNRTAVCIGFALKHWEWLYDYVQHPKQHLAAMLQEKFLDSYNYCILTAACYEDDTSTPMRVDYNARCEC